MPQLLGFFQQLLNACQVTAHTDYHKRKLSKLKMEKSDYTKWLIYNSNIWNLAIIDNIDFKKKSFKYGNIYDAMHSSSHATLRMTFQIKLSFEKKIGIE